MLGTFGTNRVPARSHQGGLTLIELMIAMVIGLVLIGTVISVFLGMRATYSYQEALSRVQENGRFATQFLARELRMAGYTGCSNNIFNWLNPAGSGYVTSIYGDRTVTGWDASSTAPGDSYIAGTSTTWTSSTGEAVPAEIGTVLPGSDIIIVNSSEPLDVELQGNPGPPANTVNAADATGIPQGAIIMAVTSSCAGGDLWMKTSNENASSLPKGTAAGHSPGNINPSGGFTQEYDDDSNLYRWTSTAFFLSTNASTPPEPALYRLRLDEAKRTGTANPQELVAGVESMQIAYGVDDDADREVDRYLSAAVVPDWAAVHAVRIALLLRNDTRVPTETELTDFTLAHTTITPTEENRARQVMTLTVALRNELP